MKDNFKMEISEIKSSPVSKPDDPRPSVTYGYPCKEIKSPPVSKPDDPRPSVTYGYP